MTGAELLTAGKALIWFAVPLVLAACELRRTRRLLDARDDSANDTLIDNLIDTPNHTRDAKETTP